MRSILPGTVTRWGGSVKNYACEISGLTSVMLARNWVVIDRWAVQLSYGRIQLWVGGPLAEKIAYFPISEPPDDQDLRRNVR